MEQPITNYGVTHTDRVRISPIGGCAWRCQFCDLPYEHGYRKKHADDLMRVIELAAVDPAAPARHVPHQWRHAACPGPRTVRPPGERRRGVARRRLRDGGRALAAAGRCHDAAASRRSHPAWLKSAGINAVSINLEISDPERTRKLAPAKAKLGREYSLGYIERAVEAFGVGFVQSLLVFGGAIEPLESTLRGVRDLVDRGCMPVLSPFRPHSATPLAGTPAASYDEIVEAYARTVEICVASDTEVRPGPRCVPCQHNTATLPDGSSFYAGRNEDLTASPCLTS